MQGTAYRYFHNPGVGNNPVLVLIHGLGLNQHIWDDYLKPLRQNYSLLTYDLCGHGDTVLPTETPTMSLFARQLDELLDELNISTPCSLIGFSLGGMINRRVAMDSPHRVHSLVILNSPHERSAQAQKLVEARAQDTASGGAAATIDETLKRWFTDDYRRRRPEYLAQVKGTVLGNDPVNYTNCRWVLANGVIELIRPQPPIDKPTLVMTCENDTGSTVAMARSIQSEIGNAELRIIPGLQHMGLVEAPELFIEAIHQFLDQLHNQFPK